MKSRLTHMTSEDDVLTVIAVVFPRFVARGPRVPVTLHLAQFYLQSPLEVFVELAWADSSSSISLWCVIYLRSYTVNVYTEGGKHLTSPGDLEK